MINSCAAIVIAAKHGELTKVRDCEGITYTVGTLRCKFDFRTTDWNYTTRTAVFCKGNVETNPIIADKAIGVLLDKVDECAVPPEVLLPDEKYFSVGVWGVTEDGLRIVSKWLVFRIKDGCYVNSSESIPPTPTVYEQIISVLSLKAPIEHEHEDKYYSKKDIDDKLKNISFGTGAPIKISQLENDVGYLTEYTETDPTVPSWAKSATKPAYTASEVGADPAGSASNALDAAKQYTNEKISTVDVSAQISTHNTNTASHNDIRLKVQEIANRLNAFLDTNDTTLDQLSEIITYIKDNKELIESVTTTKVNVDDIVDNLITSVANKPLSANQGVVLKSLIDAIVVPTKISQLSNDAGYLNSIPDEYITEFEVEDLTNDILNKAKQSGEFDGKDGKDGQDGYTPQKGVDYYTEEDKEELVTETAARIDISGKADKATTLSGYGITDAFTKTEIEDITGNKENLFGTKYSLVDAINEVYAENYNKADKKYVDDITGDVNNLVTQSESLVDSINEIFDIKADKTDIPTKLSDLEDDSKTNYIKYAANADAALRDSEGNVITSTYAMKPTINPIPTSSTYVYDFSSLYNCDTRLEEASIVSIAFKDDEYAEDYISSLSFNSGETPTALDYTDSGIINWVGTDCTNDNGLSIFQPSPNTHYDIVFHFNGAQFIGLVNGFVPAKGNVVSE